MPEWEAIFLTFCAGTIAGMVFMAFVWRIATGHPFSWERK